MNDIAKEQAKKYLERSIRTLSSILGVDPLSITEIPVSKESALYDSYFCLLHEIAAYKKLLENG